MKNVLPVEPVLIAVPWVQLLNQEIPIRLRMIARNVALALKVVRSTQSLTELKGRLAAPFFNLIKSLNPCYHACRGTLKYARLPISFVNRITCE